MEKIVVAVTEGDDKIKALDSTIERCGFFNDLKKSLQKSGKKKEEFKIVVKPNIMMGYNKKYPHVATDPELVEHLIKKMRENHYTNIAVVESQNFFMAWFPKKTVKRVATAMGYTGDTYNIVDLTKEAEPYNYGGKLGEDFVGGTWRDADYRISFPKNKTHSMCLCTLSMKNIFGTLPVWNKREQYHKGVGWDHATIDVLRHFPPDFAFVDAFWSSDGTFGAYIESPKYTKTIMGGKNFVAVDWVGAQKMGLNPMDYSLMQLAVDVFGIPEFEVDGSLKVYENWVNSSVQLGKLVTFLDFTKIPTLIFYYRFKRLSDPELV
ncbi:MAG: DUF362 domain-containing protein [Candidatus Methanofastidiosia archaeon]|jgi:uncharacterized protein (DUF362 family)